MNYLIFNLDDSKWIYAQSVLSIAEVSRQIKSQFELYTFHYADGNKNIICSVDNGRPEEETSMNWSELAYILDDRMNVVMSVKYIKNANSIIMI